MDIYQTNAHAPIWADELCPEGSEALFRGLYGMKADGVGDDFFVAHLFTGCGHPYGLVGVAYVGPTCYKNWNVGVTEIHDTQGVGPWLTFAHELGHNIGADHSFDDGQGKTGGIMDYGVGGMYNEEIQFNSQYAKAEICRGLRGAWLRCDSKNFQLTESGAT
eukprot:1648394-Amphidinium_carterae.2